MANAAKNQATYEDLLRVPENMIGEIVFGTLVTQPRPASPHAWAATALTGDLDGPFRRGRGGPGGWVLLLEPEIHFGADAVVPDMAGWRRERMPAMPEVPFFTLAPDWVMEIVSPSTMAHDRVDKASIYAREGVRFLWFVDPTAHTLETHTLENGRWLRTGAQAVAARGIRLPNPRTTVIPIVDVEALMNPVPERRQGSCDVANVPRAGGHPPHDNYATAVTGSPLDFLIRTPERTAGRSNPRRAHNSA
jgi:Uma2 family endonuclease